MTRLRVLKRNFILKSIPKLIPRHRQIYRILPLHNFPL